MSISALLSELIKSSIGIRAPYAPDSREARIMRLILDELSLLPALPLQLPQPADRRIGTICSTLRITRRPSGSQVYTPGAARRT